MSIIKEFIQEEDGVGVVEIILILVILIGLVLLFRTEIKKIVENAFNSIKDDSDEIIND
ncbi:Flp1 family type IVb pilin [Anaeromicropila populeti]|uniref:Putative Flagellin, Flp1-like, domain n=1 Tax=Anaeromicropila populeti TaxID=37658 RepID=A0A1I6LS47_9FIRM|nr:Flp1 family type IVb pilin [Anaeromicropila populeti]SFS06249.1 Putative Flagellin, Flp1-like, domain [Anaeromicropila populeti]